MQYLIMTIKMNNLQVSQKDMEKEIAQLEFFIKSNIDARELKGSGLFHSKYIFEYATTKASETLSLSMF